jgi:peptide/nickel transport system substrate-binding protein
VLGALLALAGCESAQQDVLVFAVAKPPASLHPLLASDATSERINALLYQPLVKFDSAQRPLPGAVRWEALSETRYRLRFNGEPAPFSNGSRPTLLDVEAVLAMASHDSRSPHAATLAHVASLHREGEHLDVFLSRPDPRFAEKLHLGLAPAELLPGDDLIRGPVGSGAFVFERWDAQNAWSLRRKRDGQRIHFEAVPDPTMRALKLKRGEVHLMQNDLPYELYAHLQQEGAVRLQYSPGSTFSYLGFNLRDEHAGNRSIRAAVAHAIDRDALVRYLFQGFAEPTNTLLRPEHWSANPNLQAYAYKPQESRRLLAALGYSPARPLQLSYKTSTDPFRLRIAAALQAQLAQVGIELQIQSYEWGTFFADIKAGNFQLYSLSWVGIRSPDIFRYVYHSDSLPPGGANRGGYVSAEADRLIEMAEQSPAQQAAVLYRDAQARIHHDLVYVPLWHEHNLLLSRGVQTPAPQSDGAYMFLEQVSLEHE